MGEGMDKEIGMRDKGVERRIVTGGKWWRLYE